MLISLIFVIAGFLSILQAQDIHFGKCPDVALQEDFDAEKFEGTWYELKTTKRLDLEAFEKCVTFDFSNVSKGVLTIESLKVGRIFGSKSRKVETIKPQEPGHYKSNTYDYKVVSTDYNTYAVVSGCQDSFLTHKIMVWIFSRNRQITMEEDLAVTKKVEEAGLPTDSLRSTIQNDCPQDNADTVASSSE